MYTPEHVKNINFDTNLKRIVKHKYKKCISGFEGFSKKIYNN